MPLWVLSLLGRAKAVPPSAWGWVAAIIAVLLLLSTCAVVGIKSDREKDRQTRAANEDRGIREEASETRLEDAKRIDDNKEKLDEAVASLPDAVPSDRRIALACQRLRNDGHLTLPTICGPSSGGQAPARP